MNRPFSKIIASKSIFLEKIFFWSKKNLFKEEFYTLFSLTLIFYLFLFFNPNNKTLILFFFIYLLVVYLLTKDFRKSLFLAYLASWPLRIGKTYEIPLVSPNELINIERAFGISEFIVISIREIFMVMMFLVFLRDLLIKKVKDFRLDWISIFLFLNFLTLVLSSIFGSLRPEISLTLSLFALEPLILYLFLKKCLPKKELLLSSLAVFASMIIVVSSLATLQFIKRGTLGLSIEISHEFLPLSLGIDEDVFIFRPLATFYHANELAQFLLPYLFIFLPSLFFVFKKADKILAISFLFGFWVFLLSLGRAAWLSFLISFFIWLFVLEKRWHLRLKIRKNFLRLGLKILPLFLLIFVGFVLPRLINTFNSFQIYGGVYTRWELVKESLKTIGQFPLFGVGLGMDVFYSFQQSLNKLVFSGVSINIENLYLLQQYLIRSTPSVFSYFPEAVHNGFLHLLSQVGFIAFTVFLTCCGLLLKRFFTAIKAAKKTLNKVVLLAVALGILSLFFNNFFQAFIPNLQEIVFLTIIFTSQDELRQLI